MPPRWIFSGLIGFLQRRAVTIQVMNECLSPGRAVERVKLSTSSRFDLVDGVHANCMHIVRFILPSKRISKLAAFPSETTSQFSFECTILTRYTPICLQIRSKSWAKVWPRTHNFTWASSRCSGPLLQLWLRLRRTIPCVRRVLKPCLQSPVASEDARDTLARAKKLFAIFVKNASYTIHYEHAKTTCQYNLGSWICLHRWMILSIFKFLAH